MSVEKTKFQCHRLEGKVAIVTAATLGIGLAIVERLAHEGAKVVISSRRQANIDTAIDSLVKSGICRNRLAGIACHVGDVAQLQKLVDFTIEKFGRIDILVNNAGINPVFGSALDVSDEMFDKLFQVNVKSGFILTKLVVPHMKKTGGGNIIFNASFGGYLAGPGIGVYSVTKTTLLGLTKMLATELAPLNIRVNGIAPGVIKTKMSSAIIDEDTGKPALLGNPMDRVGTPEECAGAVAFLVSSDGSYITGETILINGGGHARL
uniref:Dehydrogenase/reductase SDR family member 4 n=1 Tax=Panagrellus redivivus TaxID=6233 RepID=A0A7E4ZRA3_PANRE